jgi:hypothetical protein
MSMNAKQSSVTPEEWQSFTTQIETICADILMTSRETCAGLKSLGDGFDRLGEQMTMQEEEAKADRKRIHESLTAQREEGIKGLREQMAIQAEAERECLCDKLSDLGDMLDDIARLSRGADE